MYFFIAILLMKFVLCVDKCFLKHIVQVLDRTGIPIILLLKNQVDLWVVDLTVLRARTKLNCVEQSNNFFLLSSSEFFPVKTIKGNLFIILSSMKIVT